MTRRAEMTALAGECQEISIAAVVDTALPENPELLFPLVTPS